MIVFVHQKDFPNEDPTRIMIDYFSPLQEVLDRFNRESHLRIEKLYNQYGQEIPLSYRVQKSGLRIYYHHPRTVGDQVDSSD